MYRIFETIKACILVSNSKFLVMQDSVSKFVAQLKESGVFAKEVRSAGVAFHSYYMASIAPALLSALQKVSFS